MVIWGMDVWMRSLHVLVLLIKLIICYSCVVSGGSKCKVDQINCLPLETSCRPVVFYISILVVHLTLRLGETRWVDG